MLPLAMILKGQGAAIGGSDRSRDQGRTPEKFAWLEAQGIEMFPQDGSGITSADQTLVASAAVEDTVPEVIRAKELGCLRTSRAELLSALFNRSACGIAVGGTSGKSTVTGMLGWIMHQAGRDPTIMNGAVMKNFVAPGTPFASARVGAGDVFVSEVDESDGSIALYRPEIAVLNNVSLDHKSLEELRVLFGDFLMKSRVAIVNADDEESTPFLTIDQAQSFGFREDATYRIVDYTPDALGSRFDILHNGKATPVQITMPGRHNVLNATAAIAASHSLGIPLSEAASALSTFTGLARRFDILGTSSSGITVIDDFGHNPEKCAATLRTLKSQPGRVIAFFQPHGYGPLRQMGHELAATFARELGAADLTVLCDPVYFGGTVDRSEGSERIVRLIEQAGGTAKYIPSREACGEYIISIARPGDRIVIMGARDDTLTTFAKGVLTKLG